MCYIIVRRGMGNGGRTGPIPLIIWEKAGKALTDFPVLQEVFIWQIRGTW